MAGVSVESCRFVARRSPGGHIGSVLDVGNRLPRVRGRSHRWIPMRTGAQLPRGLHHDPPKFSIQSSLESTERSRMRPRGPSDLGPIPEDVREPIWVRKKCAIWARWRPVPVKNVNYPRAPKNRNNGLVGPHTTPPIVNYKYMTYA